MRPFKAPGPDGFQAGFYQKTWHIVGDSIYNYVVNFFTTGELSQGINDTFLVLIPKVQRPEVVSQLRPISLCNVSYKILTKAITNRLKKVMPKIIGPYQSSFVPGRQIVDNIIIYQEVLHSMRKKKGGKGYMAIKIDLEKAYDRLSWDFIRDTLMEIGLNSEWIRNIMKCIETPRMSILLNGEQLEWFYPERGVRQGDSISPYLFVLCIERLSHIICQAVHSGDWKAMKLSRHGPELSHLFFADDMVLFAEASVEQIQVIMDCLNRFCMSSGQRINVQKSQLFVSSNVDKSTAEELSLLSGIPLTNDMGRYLGVPSIHGRVTQNMYKGIVDRVSSRLEGWKSKYLSLAGRQVMAQSVLSSIPLYSMQTTLLPVGICSKLEQIIRNFLWGGTNGERKCSLIKWEMVVKSKKEGGLGIRSLHQMNLAFLAKLCWRMLKEKESLWVQVVSQKYIHNVAKVNSFKPKASSSNVWQGLSRAASVFHMGIRCLVTNGRDTSFWLDVWITNEPLKNYLLHDINLIDMYKTVYDYWIQGIGWNLEVLQGLLPPQIIHKLSAFFLHEEEGMKDGICWGVNSSGNFTVKSAYDLAMGNPSDIGDDVWRHIWRLRIPNKICTFLWLLKHKRLMCNAERKRRGFTTQGNCDSCTDAIEDVDHLFRFCADSVEIWRHLLPPSEFQRQLTLSFDGWLQRNITENLFGVLQLDWNVTFSTAVWWIWRWRNARVFKQESYSIDFKINWIKAQTSEILQATRSKVSVFDEAREYVTKFVGWMPPPNEWITLNTDGCCKGSSELAGCGGLLRNTNGDWIKGYSYNIGSCNALAAEMWGAIKGLEIAWSEGHRKVLLEMDSALAVKWINERLQPTSLMANLFARCFHLMGRNWEVRVGHIYREQNRAIDFLFSAAFHHGKELVIYDDPPLSIQSIITEDKRGVAWVRRVPLRKG